MEEPLRQMVANAGDEPSVVLQKVAEGKGNYGEFRGQYGEFRGQRGVPGTVYLIQRSSA
jgi:hypothetical protein